MIPSDEPRTVWPAGSAAPAGSPGPAEAWPPEYLLERMAWLLRLRWIAVAGVSFAIICAAGLGVVLEPLPLLAIALGLAAFNVYAWSRWRTLSSRPGTVRLELAIFSQLVGDLVALALLLHYSGGVENPFAMFFAFHMTIAAMLLPSRLSLSLALIAASLHGGTVLGEFAGALDHHPLFTVAPGLDHPAHSALLWTAPTFVLGYLLAFSLMLFGITYFVQSVVERHRHVEALRREHERVAVSRERLARVGALAAGVAHAVRNPLHGLINSMDLLAAKNTADSSERETLALMGEACRRIEAVTQRLLVLTREDTLCKSPHDLGHLVQEAVRWLPHGARGSAARIETRLDPTGAVEVDANRLTEALINVIDNAVDACRDGGVVTVRTLLGSEVSDSDTVCIEVSDTGAGIVAEDLAKVFDPFFTTKPAGEGTGLGLALTRQIVEGHGGEVSIDSTPGKGTRVRILIPREEPASKEGAGT